MCRIETECGENCEKRPFSVFGAHGNTIPSLFLSFLIFAAGLRALHQTIWCLVVSGVAGCQRRPWYPRGFAILWPCPQLALSYAVTTIGAPVLTEIQRSLLRQLSTPGVSDRSEEQGGIGSGGYPFIADLSNGSIDHPSTMLERSIFGLSPTRHALLAPSARRRDVSPTFCSCWFSTAFHLSRVTSPYRDLDGAPRWRT